MSYQREGAKAAGTPGERLRALMGQGCVGMPGAFNGMVARIARDTGFEALYVSGAAVSASFGAPDVGLVTLTEFCNVIEQVSRGSGLPVLADADTGFGESEMTARAAWEYSRAGAAGFHIEDQVFPKRCGHLDGKALIKVDHIQEKVSAAGRARDAMGNGFVVCARTDARSVEGMEAVVSRARAYIDAGADMIFPEGLTSEKEFGEVAEALRASHPGCFLLANMTEFGKTPIIPLARFAALGYHAVIFPVTTLRVAMGAVARSLAALHRDGHVETFLKEMQTREELYKALRYTPGQEWAFPGR